MCSSPIIYCGEDKISRIFLGTLSHGFSVTVPCSMLNGINDSVTWQSERTILGKIYVLYMNFRIEFFICYIGIFPKWNRNSVKSGNLINHSSMNWSQFKKSYHSHVS